MEWLLILGIIYVAGFVLVGTRYFFSAKKAVKDFKARNLDEVTLKSLAPSIFLDAALWPWSLFWYGAKAFLLDLRI